MNASLTHYSVSLQTDVSGEITVTVPAGVAGDEVGNLNTASEPLRIALNRALSVADASAVEGTDETIDFEVTLDAASDCQAATVDWATAGGTATAPADYTAATGTLTFSAGETTQTIVVVVADDGVAESPEDFQVTLSNPTNATIAGAVGTGQITDAAGITNTPATGQPTITGTAQVGKTLTASVDEIEDDDGLTGVTFAYQWLADDGSIATEIAGATGTSYTLTAAEAGKTIKVRVTFTDRGGTQETLLSVATAVVAARPSVPAVSVAAGSAPVTEGSAAAFLLARTGTAAEALTVTVSVTESGAMLQGTPATTVAFDAGASTAELAVATEDDETVETASVITAAIVAGNGYTVAANGSTAAVTAEDDDAAPVVATASPLLVPENATAVATLGATDADTPAADLSWSPAGGADAAAFSLTAGGVLAFQSAPDFEAPDDADTDGDYEVTVRVTDGANAAEAALTVRLVDVDDTAPELTDATVTGVAADAHLRRAAG